MRFSVKILGARGSVPVFGAPFHTYGGSTTCFLIRAGERALVVDAGTGLMNLEPEMGEREHLDLILTHAHLDHMLGLPLCPFVMRKDRSLTVYAKTRHGLDARAQIHAMLQPPLWPVGTDELPARVDYSELNEKMVIANLGIRTMEGDHPGGVSLIRIETGHKSAVIATDTTVTVDNIGRIAAFAEGCDLLICDGQYADEEWAGRSRFGHSTWTSAARLGAAAGAKRVLVTHHDPTRTDDALRAAARQLAIIHPRCTFAAEGEEISL